jgi:hypothetical protein
MQDEQRSLSLSFFLEIFISIFIARMNCLLAGFCPMQPNDFSILLLARSRYNQCKLFFVDIAAHHKESFCLYHNEREYP